MAMFKLLGGPSVRHDGPMTTTKTLFSSKYRNACLCVAGSPRSAWVTRSKLRPVATRRRLATGRNFDLVTQADLGDPATQGSAMRYLDKHNVLVVVMGPSCRTLGPPSNLNMAIKYDTWLRYSNEDEPHLFFCGQVVVHQLRKGRTTLHSRTSVPKLDHSR